MNHKAEYFLDLYKQIEELLGSVYSGQRIDSNPVKYFAESSEGKAYREELNICREVRNLLSHNPKINGEAAVMPSDESVKFLEKLLNRLENPPLAMEYATKNIVFTSYREKVIPLMKKMEMRGYSHIPVIEKGRFTGVFSISTIFSYVIDNPDYNITENTEVGFFKNYLPAENHANETFVFVNPNADYWTAKRLMEKKKMKNKRLAAIFITSNGLESGKLLGMLTPLDIIKKEIETNDIEEEKL
ncbi:MAG: CBS domain-containing protein [Clostridia bacterium]|nr:CBS domain-containing protein [Clostridia bacterium]